jgi:4-hydroxy-3-polyprenylbenzoate decarboxylase
MTASMSPRSALGDELAGAYRGSPADGRAAADEIAGAGAGGDRHRDVIRKRKTAIEGPFKKAGYYTHQGPEAVVRIQRTYYRDKPIIAGAPLRRSTGQLHQLSICGASSVPASPDAGRMGFYNGLLTVVSLKQRYAGHAKQALITAAGFRHGDMKTYYVTVDDDIDPTNQEEVLWAMCTRVDPTTAVDVVRDAWTADLDPRVSRAAGGGRFDRRR